MKQRNLKMFKKTLLALTIAGTASVANASNIYVSVTDAVAADVLTKVGTITPAAGEALGLNGVLGADDNCDVLATKLGVTLTGTAPNIASAGGDDDVISFVAQTGQDKASVAMSGLGTCNVLLGAETKNTTAVKDGIEYSSVKAIEITPSLIVGLGGLKDEDTLTINMTGAKIDVAKTLAPSIVVAGDNGVSGAGGVVADISFDVLDVAADGTQVRFTVQSSAPGTKAVAPNAILDISGIFLDSTGLSNSTSVALSAFATNTSGTQYDPANAQTVTTLTPQYTAEVTTKFDALIDVSQDRQTFSTANADSLTLKVTKNTDNLELTPAEATYAITGDFSWMKDKSIDANENGTLTSAELATAVGYAGADAVKSRSLNAAMDTLTIVTTTGAAVDAAPVVTFTVPGYDNGALANPVIAVQDFTVKVDVADNKAFSTAAVNMPATAAVDAGRWELNGSVIYLPYVPFGPNTQPIIRHTNKGTRSGDITVRYMVEGVDTTWNALTAANVADAKPGVRNMLSLVTDALKDEGYDASKTGFKVALEFVTNVPARDVFVYGGAKITAEGQDRIHLGTLKDND
jgi:hypothetical protein